jgi:stromal membrane-associated protein
MLYVRYEEKRWVPRDGKAKSPSRVNGEKTPTRSSGHGQMNDTNHVLEERKVTRPPITNGRSPSSRSSTPMPVKASTPMPVKASTPLPVKASSPLPVKAYTPLAVKASQKVDTLSLLLAFVSSATSITFLSASTILVKYVSYV